MAQNAKPNVLVIISDHLSTRAVGAYDESSWADTPHIDRIAKRGVRFDNMYTSCPLCAPARASFWTGRYPHDTGVLANGKKVEHADILPNRDVPEDMPTLGATFKEAGYQTIHFGKCHDSGALRGFDIVPDGQIKSEQVPAAYPENSDTWKDNWAMQRFAEWAAGGFPEPFCCVVDLQNPHNICGWIGEHSSLDGPVGEEGGVLDDTFVVLMADHGDGMGSHQTATKQVAFYEETMRVPFIVAGPGVKKGGQRINTLTSLLDLFPGLCEYAGIAAPEDLPGKSFAPLLKAEETTREFVAAEWYSEWGYTVSPGRMIRSKDFKYVSYLEGSGGVDDPTGGEQLYDLRQDRFEVINLATDPTYRAVLLEHRAMLQRHVREQNDPFYAQKVVVDKKWRSHAWGYRHHEGPPAPMAGEE